jgi:hypothetical protein
LLTSRHEAGHAVAAFHYNCFIAFTSSEPEGIAFGTTRLGLELRQDAIVLSCGPLVFVRAVRGRFLASAVSKRNELSVRNHLCLLPSMGDRTKWHLRAIPTDLSRTDADPGVLRTAITAPVHSVAA